MQSIIDREHTIALRGQHCNSFSVLTSLLDIKIENELQCWPRSAIACSRSIILRTELMPEKNIFVNEESEQPLPEALHLEPKVTKVVPGFQMLFQTSLVNRLSSCLYSILHKCTTLLFLPTNQKYTTDTDFFCQYIVRTPSFIKYHAHLDKQRFGI